MGKPITVLYVEDDEDIRAIAEMALEDDNFFLMSCSSGEEALEKAALSDPDLLLLDVMMPGMDGPTTLNHLRQIPHITSTPVIFMTAKVQPTEVKAYLECGALGVISKPFDPMGLADEIKTILKKA
ncbi:response regulator [Enterovibrio nigricans]|uniref:Response regulator receiver domain-containing protein n=1 Tax=Enterovibrio nigricans DSM 22720 TaxID=1121868 RepID=A0A1T4TS08_9GAMM|nr:response regulator [Enterovibrio nigricans]PKF51868.1 response regulator [Enterovibrio nigricans]SKA43235.1 Response regulator receiver domain-containing protein [Enterovibrio nigricans DSM 22720]